MAGNLKLSFNARRILSVLRAGGPQSRADLARALDLTPPTLTRLCASLIDSGLLAEQEDPRREGRRGYPARALYIRPGGLFTAGVYIDPDRIMTCISDLTGGVVSQDDVPVPDRSFRAIMTVAGDSVARQIASLGIDRARMAGCGVSYPGQYSQDPTRVLRIRQFADWPSVNVERDLAPYFGMPVRHMNDAKAACLGELYHGACRDVPDFCHIWLSYGIGGAAVVDHRPYLGRNNGAAEWGGMFPKTAPRPSGQDLLDTLERDGSGIARLADFTDAHLSLPLVSIWRERAAEQLRWLCLVIARTFAPNAIVIGGTLHPGLIEGFIDHISSQPRLGEDFLIPPPRILRAMRDDLPQMGAAALPIHHLMNPATFAGQVSKSR